MSTTPQTLPVSSPPGQEGQGARLAASANVGQVEGTIRADSEIVDRTEEAARFLAAWRWGGVPEYEGCLLRNSSNAKLLACWDAACILQEIMTDSDARNAAAEVDGA